MREPFVDVHAPIANRLQHLTQFGRDQG
jgi:hypothetical protein